MIPQSQARSRKTFRGEKHKNESNPSKVEWRKIDPGLPIRIAAYQLKLLRRDLESHDSSRMILNRPILDSEYFPVI